MVSVSYTHLQRLNHLIQTPMDFESPLSLETDYQTDSPFCRILADYWLTVINKDYDWNLFFRMLFALEPGSNVDDLSMFLNIVTILQLRMITAPVMLLCT